MRHKALIYTATMLVLTALTTSAYATRIFAGSECQVFNPTQVTGIPDYDFAGLSNSGAAVADLTVICPVVRDNTSNINGTKNFTARVASNGSDLLFCTFYSLDENGTLIDVNTQSTTSGVPVTLNLDVGVSANKGYYNMACTLPPGTTIFSYRLEEF
jgi:hypothetical protein